MMFPIAMALLLAAALGADTDGDGWGPYFSGNQAIADLAKRLESSDPDVRRGAAAGLADLGARATPAALPLAMALDDPDPLVRFYAVEALSLIGPKAVCVAGTAMRFRKVDESWIVSVRATNVFTAWRSEAKLRCASIRPKDADEILTRSNGVREKARSSVQARTFPLGLLALESTLLFSSQDRRHDVNEAAEYRLRKSPFHDGLDALSLFALIRKHDALRKASQPGVHWPSIIASIEPDDALSLQLFPMLYPRMGAAERRRMLLLSQIAIERTFEGAPPLDRLLLERVVLPKLGSSDSQARTLAYGLAQQMLPFADEQRAELLRLVFAAGDNAPAQLRISAMQLLSEHDPGGLDWLESILTRDPVLEMRRAAMLALSRRSDLAAGRLLLRVVADDREPADVRIEALGGFRAVAERGHFEVGPRLREIEQQLVRVVAIDELKQLVKEESDLGARILKARRTDLLRLARDALAP